METKLVVTGRMKRFYCRKAKVKDRKSQIENFIGFAAKVAKADREKPPAEIPQEVLLSIKSAVA